MLLRKTDFPQNPDDLLRDEKILRPVADLQPAAQPSLPVAMYPRQAMTSPPVARGWPQPAKTVPTGFAMYLSGWTCSY